VPWIEFNVVDRPEVPVYGWWARHQICPEAIVGDYYTLRRDERIERDQAESCAGILGELEAGRRAMMHSTHPEITGGVAWAPNNLLGVVAPMPAPTIWGMSAPDLALEPVTPVRHDPFARLLRPIPTWAAERRVEGRPPPKYMVDECVRRTEWSVVTRDNEWRVYYRYMFAGQERRSYWIIPRGASDDQIADNMAEFHETWRASINEAITLTLAAPARRRNREDDRW
jgi:hypothetical protein